jgi:hypothetical protein
MFRQVLELPEFRWTQENFGNLWTFLADIKNLPARHQWPMSIILSTQEAKIRRIAVQSQPGQIFHKTLSQNSPSQKRTVEWLKV